MKEIFKKIAVAGVGSILLTGVSFASVGNEGTGRDSNNEVDWFSRHTLRVETENEAEVNNELMVHQNTGENEAEDNDGDASIDTGDASVTASVTNRVNDASVDVEMPESSDNNDVMNSDTGRDSNNEVDFDEINETSVEVENSASVNNCIHVMQNTGNNEAEENDGDVSITTGNASANVSVSNTVNTSSVSVNN